MDRVETTILGAAGGNAVDDLVRYAIIHGLLDEADAIWARNAIMEILEAEAPLPPRTRANAGGLRDLLDELLSHAINQWLLEPEYNPERFAMRIMGAITPRPSQVRRRFDELMASQGARAACDYFHTLCGDVDYIKRDAIARDIKWTAATTWGDLEITINKSKPEKDPRAIAQAAQVQEGERYPACQLCLTNEGYAGRLATSPLGGHPARQNLRIVEVPLLGERWGLQYSPYAYYNEHCIVINPQHVPMHIDRATMGRLLDFVDAIGHYFVGSNADLPIVGGSILSHDHFQGGGHVFAMDRAPVAQPFDLAGYPQVSAGVLRWPVSVIRLESASKADVLDAACHVLNVWKRYSDADAGILARTGDVPHNTITPIARKVGEAYVLNLALRCNITSDAHPLGVFHPHAQLHHIKKENIGLIEVMGLAILPGRLEYELDAVGQALVELSCANAAPQAVLQALEGDPLCDKHAAWAAEVLVRHPELDRGNVAGILRAEVGQVFAQVLECAGVFKWDEAGRAACSRFLAAL